jgi:transcriptional regulator of acetoin/glycerol metabolism
MQSAATNRDLAKMPLEVLLPAAVKKMKKASLDELAKAILALPVKGSKLEAVQRAVVLHAIATCEGNVSAASRLLGVDRKALERKLLRFQKKK